MLVVQSCPKTFTLIHRCRPGRYIFRVREDGIQIRFIHPDRRLQFDGVVTVEEARETWKLLRQQGYYWW